MTDRIGTQRHQYLHQGQLVYEWEQTLTDCTLYVTVPAGARAKDLAVDIKPDSLAFGLKGNPPFLAVSMGQDGSSHS